MGVLQYNLGTQIYWTVQQEWTLTSNNNNNWNSIANMDSKITKLYTHNVCYYHPWKRGRKLRGVCFCRASCIYKINCWNIRATVIKFMPTQSTSRSLWCVVAVVGWNREADGLRLDELEYFGVTLTRLDCYWLLTEDAGSDKGYRNWKKEMHCW